MTTLPAVDDLNHAAERLAGRVHRTPVATSRRLNAELDASLYFKCENLQRTGSFKIRGATNAVLSLADHDAARGVATHSSGNHGAALAAAAAARGVPSYIVVPDDSIPSKIAAIEGYGGNIIRCEPTHQSREDTLASTVAETAAHVVHPYNDPRIIAGQGTATLELLDEVPDLDVVIAPVGGGGLISGATLAAMNSPARPRIIGAEPAGADDAARSLATGQLVMDVVPDTVADGLRARIGPINFAMIREGVEQIVTVSDDDILAAMHHVWHTMKLVIEPSSATVLAAARSISQQLRGLRVGLIFSGGNADLSNVAFCGRCGWQPHG